MSVVNCFQIVFYRSLTQQAHWTVIPVVLWIAFKLYFIDLWHSWFQLVNSVTIVVNCFQIVFYWSLTQLNFSKLIQFHVVVNCFQIVFYWSLTQLCCVIAYRESCCELLSNCILSIFDTALVRYKQLHVVNCFQIVFYRSLTQLNCITIIKAMVVNCFQIVFYRSLTQASWR